MIEIYSIAMVVRAIKYYPKVFLEVFFSEIINNIKMRYYDRIDVSEGIDVNMTKASKECNICHY